MATSMCIPSVIPVSAVRLSLCIFSLCIGYIYIYIYTHIRAHAQLSSRAWQTSLSALSAGSVWRLYSFVAVVVCLSLCVCDIKTLIDAQGLKHTRIDVCLWFTQGGCRSSAPADAKEHFQLQGALHVLCVRCVHVCIHACRVCAIVYVHMFVGVCMWMYAYLYGYTLQINCVSFSFKPIQLVSVAILHVFF